MRFWSGSAIVAVLLSHSVAAAAAPLQHSTLDRVASAVDGAESSYGENMTMWRADPSGPQGPMQVSAAAATDVGGGDRFDSADNRAIGRAYLELLYQRYRDWPDAIAAYNWGIGRLNAWLAAGRPSGKLAKGVAAYTDRVLRDSGLCTGATAPGVRGRAAATRIASRRRRGARGMPDDRLGSAACVEFARVPGNRIELAAAKWRSDNRLLVGLLPDGFYRQLEALMNQTELDLRAAERR
jgi:Transglycosylase SLT domain